MATLEELIAKSSSSKLEDLTSSKRSRLDDLFAGKAARIKQGSVSFLNPNAPTTVTYDNISGKGTDADSGYFTTAAGIGFGGRGVGIDTPEHARYWGEKVLRPEQKQYYAKLWGVDPQFLSDDHVFAQGLKADAYHNKLATEGQGKFDPALGVVDRVDELGEIEPYLIEAEASYNPNTPKWSTDPRAKIDLVNPATGVNIYQAMNTPEFNTRWFDDEPKQNLIRAKYEAEHGSDYNEFKNPAGLSLTNIYQPISKQQKLINKKAELQAKTKREASAIVSDAGLETLGGNILNLKLRAALGGINFLADTGAFIPDAISKGIDLVTSKETKELYKDIEVKKGKLEAIEFAISKTNPNDLETLKAIQTKKDSITYTDEEKELLGGTHSILKAKETMDYGVAAMVKQARSLNRYANKGESERVVKEVEKGTGHVIAQISHGYKQVKKGNTAEGIGNVFKGLADTVDVAETLVENPVEVLGTLADSLGEMFGLSRKITTKAGSIAFGAVWNRKDNEGVEAYKKAHDGNEPEGLDRAVIATATVGATLLAKGAADFAFGKIKIPFSTKAMPQKLQDKLFNAVPKPIQEVSIALGKLTNSTPMNALITLAKTTVAAGIVEFVSETGEALLDQYAGVQNIGKLDLAKATAEGAMAFGGSAMIRGTTEVLDKTPTIKDVAKKVKPTLDKAVDYATKQQAKGVKDKEVFAETRVKKDTPALYNFITSNKEATIEEAMEAAADTWSSMPSVKTGESKYKDSTATNTLGDVASAIRTAQKAFDQAVAKGATKEEAYKQVMDSTIFDDLSYVSASKDSKKVTSKKGVQALETKLSKAYQQKIKRDPAEYLSEVKTHFKEATVEVSKIQDTDTKIKEYTKLMELKGKLDLLESVSKENLVADIDNLKNVPEQQLEDKIVETMNATITHGASPAQQSKLADIASDSSSKTRNIIEKANAYNKSKNAYIESTGKVLKPSSFVTSDKPTVTELMGSIVNATQTGDKVALDDSVRQLQELEAEIQLKANKKATTAKLGKANGLEAKMLSDAIALIDTILGNTPSTSKPVKAGEVEAPTKKGKNAKAFEAKVKRYLKNTPHLLTKTAFNPTALGNTSGNSQIAQNIRTAKETFKAVKSNSILGKGINSFNGLFTDQGIQDFVSVQLGIKNEEKNEQTVNDIKNIVSFSQRFNATARDNTSYAKVETLAELANKPADLLKDGVGKLPQNVYNALSISSQRWLANKSLDTVNRDRDQIGKSLGYSNSDLEYSVVSSTAQKIMANTGIHFHVISAELGREAIKQLGIGLKDDADGALLAKLEMNLGDIALATLAAMNLIDINVLSGKQFNKLSPKEETKNPAIKMRFVAAKMQRNPNGTYMLDHYGNTVLTPEAQTDKDIAVSASSTFTTLFDMDLDDRAISTSPITFVPKKVKGKLSDYTPSQKKATLAKQKQAIVPLESRFNLIKRMSSKVAFLRIGGLTEPTTEKGNEFPESHKENYASIEGKNRSLSREFDIMTEHMSERKGDYTTPTFLPYNVVSNMRSMDTSNTISLQRSLMHRYMYALDTYTHTIDSKDKVAIDQFIYTINQTLGKDTINEDGVIHAKFLGIIDLINSDKEKFSKEDNELLLTEAKSYHKFSALQELATYAMAKGGSFETSLTGEADGVTNGMINAMLQLMPSTSTATIKFLERGGMLVDGKYNSYAEFIENNIDNYQATVKLMDQYLQRVDTHFNGLDLIMPNFWDEGHVKISKEGRDFGKLFFMTIAYGSGMKAANRALLDATIADIYKQLEDGRDLIELNKGLSKLLGYRVNITERTRLSWTFNEKDTEILNNQLQKTYGKAIEFAIETSLGDMIKKRDLITSAINASQAISAAFFRTKKKAVMEAKGGKNLSKAEINAIQIEMRDVDNTLNVVKTPSSTTNADSMQLSKNTKEDMQNGEGKAASAFKNGIKVNNITTDKQGNVVVQDAGVMKTISSNVKEEVMADNIGVALPALNQGMDAYVAMLEDLNPNTNGLDVFDDRIEGLRSVLDSTINNNKNFFEANFDYSYVTEVLERAEIMFSKVNELPQEEIKALQSRFFNVLPEALYQEFTTLANTEHKYLSDKDKARLKQLRNDPRAKSKTKLKGDYGKAYRGSKEYLTILRDNAQAITKNRNDYKSRVSRVNQFVNNLAWYDPIELEENIEDLAKTAFNNIETQSKGSSNDTVNKELFDTIEQSVLSPTTFQETFNALATNSRKKESETHKEHLQSLVNTLIKPLLRTNQNISVAIAEGTGETRAQIDEHKKAYVERGKGTQQHLFELSDQEALVHEILHPILGGNGNTRIKHEFNRIKKVVRNNLERKAKLAGNRSTKNIKQYIAEELFIPKDSDNNPMYLQDEALTKEKALEFVDYVLYNKNDNFEEFVVHGLANERFNKILSEIKVKNINFLEKISKAGTILERLHNIFVALLDWYNQKSYSNSDKANEIILQLMVEVNEAKTRKTPITRQYTDKLNTLIREKIVDKISAPYVKWAGDSILAANSPNRLTRYAVNATRAPLWLTSKEIRNQFNEAQYAATKNKYTFLHSLLNEIIGDSVRNRPFTDLLRYSKGVIDHKVELEAATVANMVTSGFDPDNKPTQAEWEGLNTAILETAFYKLTEHKYIYSDQVKLLEDFDFLKSVTAKRVNNIKESFTPALAKYYIQEAESLGVKMASGKHNKVMGMNNAHLIVNRKTLRSWQINMDEVLFDPEMDRSEDIKLIEELAVLNALVNTNIQSKEIGSKFLKSEGLREIEINGMENMMQLHKLHDEVSLEQNFNGNPEQTILGYTTEKYDSAIETKVAPKADEEILKRDRFIRTEYQLKRDLNDPTQKELYIYINKDSLKRANIAGAVGLNDLKAKGANLVQQARNSGEDVMTNPYNLADENLLEYLDLSQNKVFDSNNSKGDFLEPIFGNNPEVEGNIVGFKYVMHKHTKTTLLNKHDKAHETLGRMFANIQRKTDTPGLNKIIVAQLKADYNKHFHDNPSDYINISPTSPVERYREIYATLPKPMKEFSAKVFKQEGIPVRADLVDILFGYRDPSLSAYIEKVGKKYINHNTPALEEIRRKKEDINIEYLGLNDKSLYPIYLAKLEKLDRKEKALMARAGVHPDIIKLITLMENTWKKMVAIAKRVIVILIPAVVIANAISNFITGVYKGVPLKDNIKWTIEGLTELFTYQRNIKAHRELDLRLKSNKRIKNRTALEVKLGQLDQDIKGTLVHDLVQRGVYQTIVEDIDIDRGNPLLTTIGSFGKVGKTLEDKYKEAGAVIPEHVKNIAKQVLISPDTTLGKTLLNITQYSDFIARYSLHKHNMNTTNMTENESVRDILDTFVSYTDPTSMPMQWANNMGLMMFTKFMLRVQRVIAKAVYNNPADVIGVNVLERVLGGMPEITDNILTPSYAWSHMHFSADNSITNNLLEPHLLNLVGATD